jgi:hypothetical protein
VKVPNVAMEIGLAVNGPAAERNNNVIPMQACIEENAATIDLEYHQAAVRSPAEADAVIPVVPPAAEIAVIPPRPLRPVGIAAIAVPIAAIAIKTLSITVEIPAVAVEFPAIAVDIPIAAAGLIRPGTASRVSLAGVDVGVYV